MVRSQEQQLLRNSVMLFVVGAARLWVLFCDFWHVCPGSIRCSGGYVRQLPQHSSKLPQPGSVLRGACVCVSAGSSLLQVFVLCHGSG